MHVLGTDLLGACEAVFVCKTMLSITICRASPSRFRCIFVVQRMISMHIFGSELLGVCEVPVAGQKIDGIQPAVLRGPLARVAQQSDGQQRRIQQVLWEPGKLLVELLLPMFNFFGAGATRPPAPPGLGIKRAVVLAACRLHALIVGASSQADAARASICCVSSSLAWAGVGARMRACRSREAPGKPVQVQPMCLRAISSPWSPRSSTRPSS